KKARACLMQTWAFFRLIINNATKQVLCKIQKGIDFGVKPFKKGLAGFKRTESFACTGNRFSRFFTAEKCSNFNCLA
ncbi:MAG: hypothetical protein SOV73_09540, partial [Candidatus Faecivivens sp.]|nr:hypothetical protein [Candidatus Faecivivens sp.]